MIYRVNKNLTLEYKNYSKEELEAKVKGSGYVPLGVKSGRREIAIVSGSLNTANSNNTIIVQSGSPAYLYAKKDYSIYWLAANNVPRSKEDRENLVIELLDKLFTSYPNLDANMAPKVEDNKYMVDIDTSNITNAIYEKVNRHMHLNLNLENIHKLVPKCFVRIWVDGQYLRAISNIFPVRYYGATYNMGPYEFRIPLKLDFHDAIQNNIERYILVRHYDFTKYEKDLFIDAKSMCVAGRINTINLHPHIDAGSKRNILGVDTSQYWHTCCFGNYVKNISRCYLDGDSVNLLTYIYEWTKSVYKSGWYNDIPNFKTCNNPSLYFNGCKDCTTKCKPVVKDHKFYPELYDFYQDTTKIPVTWERPHPWFSDTSITKDLGGTRKGLTYVTPYYAKDFDINGFDPEGYNDQGYNKDGFDRLKLDINGYNTEGFNAQGFDRNGYNREGFNQSGFDREGYNVDGYNRAGYNRQGIDRNGVARPQDESFFDDDLPAIDDNGYDADGYDSDGYDCNGYNREGYDADGYNEQGYNEAGFDENGNPPVAQAG